MAGKADDQKGVAGGSNFEAIAQQFVEFYYKTFDSDRSQLAALYRPTSMLTFESSATLGGLHIIERLVSLPFGKIQHQVATLDAQPSGDHNGILVLVTGALLTDEEQKPLSYVQTFQLMPEEGSFYILNDMFKLIYAS